MSVRTGIPSGSVLICEYTFNGLRGAPFRITKKGAASVKGRSDSVMVYAVALVSDAETVRQQAVNT